MVLAGDDSPVEELRLLQHPGLPFECAVLLLLAPGVPPEGLVTDGLPLPRFIRSEKKKATQETRHVFGWEQSSRGFVSAVLRLVDISSEIFRQRRGTENANIVSTCFWVIENDVASK